MFGMTYVSNFKSIRFFSIISFLILISCIIPTEQTKDDLYIKLEKEIMCPVCDGQTLDQSQSLIAEDMKNSIKEKIAEGYNEEEIKNYLISYFEYNEGSFFECNKKEASKALLHRFVAASAVGRFHALNENKLGKMISLDIAFPRNEKCWFENLPQEIEDQLEMKLYYGHLFCHVLHHNYIVKKGVDADALKKRLLKIYDDVGAEYPAEHNVGHEYLAKPSLINFYKDLDPTNGFNPGIGQTSKNKYCCLLYTSDAADE